MCGKDEQYVPALTRFCIPFRRVGGDFLASIAHATGVSIETVQARHAANMKAIGRDTTTYHWLNRFTAPPLIEQLTSYGTIQFLIEGDGTSINHEPLIPGGTRIRCIARSNVDTRKHRYAVCFVLTEHTNTRTRCAHVLEFEGNLVCEVDALKVRFSFFPDEMWSCSDEKNRILWHDSKHNLFTDEVESALPLLAGR